MSQIANKFNGLLLVDKPVGFTSNQVIQRIKREFRLNRIGHTGTLDPFASGLLPCCIGEATKFSQYLLNANKTYIVEALFGEKTDTGDLDGQVIQHLPVPRHAFETISNVLQQQLGVQLQTAPQYSALKHEGKPLYHYARKGLSTPKKVREICVNGLTLLKVSLPKITFSIDCSKGTYVRTFVETLAEALDTVGHVVALRRVQCGFWEIHSARLLKFYSGTLDPNASFETLAYSISDMLSHIPALALEPGMAERLKQGQPVLNQFEEPLGLYRLLAATDSGDFQLIGLGTLQQSTLTATRMLATN